MKFLADENCGSTLISALTEAGHDVVAIVRTQPGMDDTSVFSLALQEQRVLPFDRDFGLIAERASERPPGIVLMRLHGMSMEACARIVVQAITEHGDAVLGHVTVVEPVGIRARAYKD